MRENSFFFFFSLSKKAKSVRERRRVVRSKCSCSVPNHAHINERSIDWLHRQRTHKSQVFIRIININLQRHRSDLLHDFLGRSCRPDMSDLLTGDETPKSGLSPWRRGQHDFHYRKLYSVTLQSAAIACRRLWDFSYSLLILSHRIRQSPWMFLIHLFERQRRLRSGGRGLWLHLCLETVVLVPGWWDLVCFSGRCVIRLVSFVEGY